jgi:hypothetical protein
MKNLAVLVAALVFSALGQPATIHVPVDQPTIQDAIDATAGGDTVLVAPGTYKENLDFLGKAITVISSGGNTVTTIDGKQSGCVVMFVNGEGLDSVLEGFTVTNGSGYSTGAYSSVYGGGIYCDSSSPTIRDNVITENKIETFFSNGNGAGIYCTNASPLIEGNLIWKNLATGNNHTGGGIYSGGGGSPMIVDNAIINNQVQGYAASYLDGRGGGIYCGGGHAVVARNLVQDNVASGYDAFGGGIYCMSCPSLTLENNLIIGNRALNTYKGDGDYPPPPPPPVVTGGGVFSTGTAPLIVNCTICDNSVNVSGGIAGLVLSEGTMLNSIVRSNTGGDQMSSTDPIVQFSNIQGGYPGTGNIDEDPLFFNPSDHNYRLTNYSPCINRGTRDGAPGEDIVGTPRPFMGGVDMGAWEYVGVHPLQADLFSVSASSGGSVEFMLSAGTSNGGRVYAVFASLSGTVPGYPLPGGQTHLRINWDLFTSLVYSLMNTPVFQDFYGHLSPGGSKLVYLNSPPLPPTAVGVVMYYGYCLGAPWEFVSNPVEVDIVN